MHPRCHDVGLVSRWLVGSLCDRWLQQTDLTKRVRERLVLHGVPVFKAFERDGVVSYAVDMEGRPVSAYWTNASDEERA